MIVLVERGREGGGGGGGRGGEGREGGREGRDGVSIYGDKLRPQLDHAVLHVYVKLRLTTMSGRSQPVSRPSVNDFPGHNCNHRRKRGR